MGHASVFPSGGILADIRRSLHTSVVSIDRLTTSTDGNVQTGNEGASDPPDPYAGETKWPAWKVTVAVIVFCTAFWLGVSYLVVKLFG